MQLGVHPLLLRKHGQRKEYFADLEQFSLPVLLAFLPRPQRQKAFVCPVSFAESSLVREDCFNFLVAKL
jgi:hypothetical protein